MGLASMNGPFVLVLSLVAASTWTTSAKSSRIDRYDTPNSGYCENTPPGGPLGLYLCPENPKRSGNVVRQKPERTSKPKYKKHTRWQTSRVCRQRGEQLAAPVRCR